MIYQQDLMVINFTRINAIINDWNNLSRDIIESPNLASFKSKLDVYWQDLCLNFVRPREESHVRVTGGSPPKRSDS